MSFSFPLIPKLRSLSFAFQGWSSYSNANRETLLSAAAAQLRLRIAAISSATDATPVFWNVGPLDGQPDLDGIVSAYQIQGNPTSLCDVDLLAGAFFLQRWDGCLEHKIASLTGRASWIVKGADKPYGYISC